MAKAKKNIFLKAAGLILGATMLATYVFSGTMAQYKSSGTASEVTATVGKWDIQFGELAGEATVPLTGTLDIDVSDMTIQPDDAQANSAPYEGTAPVPGTFGYKAYEITNDSVVDALVTAEASRGVNTSAGITVAVLNTLPTSAADFTNPEKLANSGNGLLATANGGTATIYVAYIWAFGDDEGTNSPADTALGTSSGQIDFGTITVTATQAKYTAPLES